MLSVAVRLRSRRPNRVIAANPAIHRALVPLIFVVLASKMEDVTHRGREVVWPSAGLLLVGFGGTGFGFAVLSRLAKDTKLPEMVFRSVEIFGNGPVMPSPDVLDPPSGLSFSDLLDW